MVHAVAAFYRFVRLADLEERRRDLLGRCRADGLRGTILIAQEGINGTVAGAEGAIASLIEYLDALCGLRAGEIKLSSAGAWPFARMKVRIRPEIITMRAPEADPTMKVGIHVEPSGWNALIDDPDTLLIDTRNDYETAVGSFSGAVDPGMGSFTDFKAFVDTLDPAVNRKVAMFCTGGIRCEKASSYMLSKGFADVFHLKGGILKYLEEVPQEESRWQGDCYVFDGRVAVGHGLIATGWTACHGCGHPLTPEDRNAASFEPGVSCPHCIADLTTTKASALRERQRQMAGA